ncbi:MAG: aldo/keto reductase [Alphaproteobacteria bacterium]
MEHRTLGRSDLRVSALCLGTMTFGQQNTKEEAFEQMDFALDQGIDFFDTAELYPIPPREKTAGRTEHMIGAWLKARGNRDRIILATKAVGRTPTTYFRKDNVAAELTRRQIFEAVDASLRRLGTDYIDLYQLHWPDRSVTQFGSNPVIFQRSERPENPIHETLEALGDLIDQGKIRQIGISNESAWGTMAYLSEAQTRSLPRIQSIQNAYNLLNRTFETGLAEIATREDVGLLAYSPLGQGYLTGKYENGALPPKSRKALFERLARYETPGAPAAITAYLDLARSTGNTPTELAIAFALSRSFITSVIIGATTMDQLRANVEASRLQLSAEQLAAIDAVHLRHTNPCP